MVVRGTTNLLCSFFCMACFTKEGMKLESVVWRRSPVSKAIMFRSRTERIGCVVFKEEDEEEDDLLFFRCLDIPAMRTGAE